MKTPRLFLFFVLLFHLTTPALHAVTGFTLTFTTKSGVKSSNEMVTVSGSVKSTIPVAFVFVSVNNGIWSPATVSTTTWSAQVTLVPGTNTVTAYAVDTSSNHSPTNAIKVVYIVTAQLSVQIDGQGSVSPNYNGASLAIGGNYTMNAKPARDFAFQYWGGGVAMTTDATLKFNMQNDLVIIAHFKDASKPVIAITSPKPNAQYGQSMITISGTASDAFDIASVSVDVNHLGWHTASGTNNWSIDSSVISGANDIQAYATDVYGNSSVIDEITFNGNLPPTWAPVSLTDTTMEFDPGTDHSFSMSFGDIGDLSQTDTNTTGDTAYGSYYYSQTGTNSAELNFSYDNPPPFQNIYGMAVLIFTNLNAGIFSNETTLAESTFAIHSQQVWLSPKTITDVLSASKFTVTPDGGNKKTLYAFNSKSITITTSSEPTQTGTIVADRVSPVMARVQITYTDTADLGHVAFLLLTFDGPKTGFYELDTFESSDNSPVGTPQKGTFLDSL